MTKTYLLVFFLLIIIGLLIRSKFSQETNVAVKKVAENPTLTPTQMPSPTVASISATPTISVFHNASGSAKMYLSPKPSTFPTK